MPTYDYKCKKCKDKFELFQKMSDEPIKECPTCGGEVERLIGKGAGLIFKGSGFYETDYKRNDSKITKETSNTKSKEKKKTESVKKETKKDKKE